MRGISRWLLLVGTLLVGPAVLTADGEETRQQRIKRLTQEALTLREQGRLDEAQRRLAEAEEQLKAQAAAGPQTASALEPRSTPRAAGAAGEGSAKGDASKDFANGLAALARGNIADAITHFERVVAKDPSSFEAHNNLAALYAEQGRDEEAVAELQTALRLRPDYYRGRKNLAEVYARLAKKAFLAAAEVAPPDEKDAILRRANGVEATRSAMGTRPLESTPALRQTSTPSPQPAIVAVEAPIATVPGKAAPAQARAPALPRQLISLGDDGSHALLVEKGTLWIYRQNGQDIRAVRGIAVKSGPELPSQARIYVAATTRDRVRLTPLDAEGPVLFLATSEQGRDAIVIDPKEMEQLASVIRSFLTPVVIGRGVETGEGGDGGAQRASLLSAFRAWQESWMSKDLDRYVANYVLAYSPKGTSGHEAWKRQRAGVFARTKALSIELSPPVIVKVGDNLVTLSQQRYESNVVTSRGVKRLTWVSAPAGWRIGAEEMLSEQLASGEKRD